MLIWLYAIIGYNAINNSHWPAFIQAVGTLIYPLIGAWKPQNSPKADFPVFAAQAENPPLRGLILAPLRGVNFPECRGTPALLASPPKTAFLGGLEGLIKPYKPYRL